jgi:two-component system sensor histidine kinase SenX3
MNWTTAIVALIAGTLGLVIGLAAGRRAPSRRMRQLEREIAESSELLESTERSAEDERRVQDLILSSMQEGVLLLNGDGKAEFANAALERHLGASPRDLGDLYPPALRAAAQSGAERTEPATTEIELSDPHRWLRATATPAGSDDSILLVVTDVTEPRRIEAVRRDFVANASHELKTPAASIQAAAETLASIADRDPTAVPRFASQLEREAMRLSRIVADLLDLSRLEAGSELGEPVRLDAVVREEAERFEARCRESGLTLSIASLSTSSVAGSNKDLSLLVRNLIDNAIRYTRPGGQIEVAVEPTDTTVELRVSDDGLGIPSRDLPRIFERFYRVDRARSRETGGTGLGLAIVKHVAENHGGTVSVESELGAGSTFTVRLPPIPAPSDQPAAR